MPFRVEAFIRSASRHVWQRAWPGKVSVERLQEQLRLETAKVPRAATRAELLDQLMRVVDATQALAAAHDITPAQLEQHRSERTGRAPRDGRDSLISFLSGLADASSARAQLTFSQLDVRARLRGRRRHLFGRSDLRVRLQLKRESHGESERRRALRELLAVTSKAELAAWIVSHTSRLVLAYLVQQQRSRFTPTTTFGSVGRAVWTRGWNASPFASRRLLASRN